MKILAYVPHYVGYDHNAGAELTIHEMLYALRKRGHNITVLLQNPVDDLVPYVIDGIKVQTYASRKDLLLHSFEADLIISHLGCAERAAIVADLKNKPMVHVIHNDHPLTHLAVEAGATYLAINTDWVAEKFEKHRVRNHVVHPPVRPEAYRTDRGDSVLLVNLWRNKGAAVFWELAKRNPKVPFIGLLGGYGEQIIPDEIPDNVTILENTGDIRTVFEQTKLVLMPSAYESYGRVALEAAASGIPSIVSRTPGLMEALGSAATYCDAPSTSVPGADAGEWTTEQFDEWDTALKKCLTPAGYGSRSKAALAHSGEVWERTEQQLERFCLEIERLA